MNSMTLKWSSKLFLNDTDILWKFKQNHQYLELPKFFSWNFDHSGIRASNYWRGSVDFVSPSKENPFLNPTTCSVKFLKLLLFTCFQHTLNYKIAWYPFSCSPTKILAFAKLSNMTYFKEFDCSSLRKFI